jgi:hypothetical protein
MDPFELTPEPEFSSIVEPLPTELNLSIERIQHMMEQHWEDQQDNSHNNDSGENEDEDEDKDKDEDESGDGDGDMGKDNKIENEILGLSAWDLLGAGFECEAVALGLCLSSGSPIKLIML